MKATKTSYIIFVIFMTALVLYMCHGGQSISGKYKVSVLPKTEATTEDQKAAMALLSAAQIQYEFLSDGTLKATTIFGEATNTATQQWTIKGDSIFIDSERYKLEKMGDGYVFRGFNLDLTLEKE